jgi:hypothetical protein
MHTILRTGPVIASGLDDQRYALGDWRSGPPRRWSGHATLTTRNADQIICHGCRAALHIGFARRRRVQRSPQRGTTNGCARQADGPRHRPRRTLASRRCLVGELKAVTLRSGERLAISFLFVFLFLGALPCTDWLADVVARDRNGLILTVPTRAVSPARSQHSGRVRSRWRPLGSSKRCATAVGEGAMACSSSTLGWRWGLARNGLQPRDRRRTPYRHGSRRGGPRGARTRRRTYDPHDACLDRRAG